MHRLAIPKFLEHSDSFDAPLGYVVTNEEPYLFNRILTDTKVQRAACIASSGEVLLSVILHRAQEIVAVDHAYSSLTVAYAKLLLLQRVPIKTIIELLRTENYDALQAHLQAVWDKVPKGKYKGCLFDNGGWRQIRGTWCAPYFQPPRVTKADVEKVTFVHGDLRDLKANHNTFDMLYASNAMEHIGRNNTCPKLSDLSNLLNPGGLLLFTATLASHTGADRLKAASLELVEQIRGYRTQWKHIVARKVA